MRIYSTLSGQKEDFTPQGSVVLMYVCGVTPYDEAHLGHAMSYIVFDTLRRYLEYRGYTVRYVQNITDIDDKIIARAGREGVTPEDLACKYAQSFFNDMGALNILPATVYPRATQEIPKIIELISGLIGKGYAYSAPDGIYFRVSSVPDYGKLSHRRLDDMMAGARVEVAREKEHPLDFALWKSSKPGEPFWESPWGPGRPGWHIECSAMSLKYLGETIDIHGGGQDLIFPHHENEIAQSEAFTGKKPFVRYWMHNGLLQLGSEKMSKSLGNLVTIKEALSRYSADAIRIFVLSSHYRGPLTYNEEALEASEKGVERLRQIKAVSHASGSRALEAEEFRQRFIEAMDDDFNTPKALAAVFDLARGINRAQDAGLSSDGAIAVLSELCNVLGLTLAEPVSLDGELVRRVAALVLGELGYSDELESSPEAVIGHLIRIRQELRLKKLWREADLIRNRLAGCGIVLEDTHQGTEWRIGGTLGCV